MEQMEYLSRGWSLVSIYHLCDKTAQNKQKTSQIKYDFLNSKSVSFFKSVIKTLDKVFKYTLSYK